MFSAPVGPRGRQQPKPPTGTASAPSRLQKGTGPVPPTPLSPTTPVDPDPGFGFGFGFESNTEFSFGFQASEPPRFEETKKAKATGTRDGTANNNGRDTLGSNKDNAHSLNGLDDNGEPNSLPNASASAPTSSSSTASSQQPTFKPPSMPSFNPGFFGDAKQRPHRSRMAKPFKDNAEDDPTFAPPVHQRKPKVAPGAMTASSTEIPWVGSGPAPQTPSESTSGSSSKSSSSVDVTMQDQTAAASPQPQPRAKTDGSKSRLYTSTPGSSRRTKLGAATRTSKDASSSKDNDFNFVPMVPTTSTPLPRETTMREPSPPPMPGSFPASPPYVDAEEDFLEPVEPQVFATPAPAPPQPKTPAIRGTKSRRPNGTSPTGSNFLDQMVPKESWSRPEVAAEAEGDGAKKDVFTFGASAASAKASASAETLVEPTTASNKDKIGTETPVQSAPSVSTASKPSPPGTANSPMPAFGQTGFGFSVAAGLGGTFRGESKKAGSADNFNFVFTPPANLKNRFTSTFATPAAGASAPTFGRPSPLGSDGARSNGSSPGLPQIRRDEDVEMAAASPLNVNFGSQSMAAEPMPATAAPISSAGPATAAASSPELPKNSRFTFEMPSPKTVTPVPPPPQQPLATPFAKTVFDWASALNASPSADNATPASPITSAPKPTPPPNMADFKKPVPPPPATKSTSPGKTPLERVVDSVPLSPKETEKIRVRRLRQEGEALCKGNRFADAIEKFTEAMASPFVEEKYLVALERSHAYFSLNRFSASARDAMEALEQMLELPIVDARLMTSVFEAALRSASSFSAMGKIDEAVDALTRAVSRAKMVGNVGDKKKAQNAEERLRTLLSLQSDLVKHNKELKAASYASALESLESAMHKVNHFLPSSRIPAGQNLGHVVPFDWIVRRCGLYVAMCKFDEAEKACAAALKVDPTSAGVLYIKALAYYIRDPDGGSLGVVEVDLGRALQFDPEHDLSRQFLRDVVRTVDRTNTAAKAKYAKGDTANVEAAKGMWESALTNLDAISLGWEEADKDTDSRKIWRGGVVRVKIMGNLASAYLKLGKTAESIKQRKSALTMLLSIAFPGVRDTAAVTVSDMSRSSYRDLFARTYALLADAHEKSNSTEESIEAWQKAHDIDPRKPEYTQGLNRAKKAQARANKVTFYTLLGIAKDATAEQIKKAYRQTALQVHPDKQPEELRPQAEAKFKQVQEAYETLSSPTKRSDYDYKLRTEEREEEETSYGYYPGAGRRYGSSAGGRSKYGGGSMFDPFDDDDFFEHLFNRGAGARGGRQSRRPEPDFGPYFQRQYGGGGSGGGSSSSSRTNSGSAGSRGNTWHTPGGSGSGSGKKR